MRKRAGPKLACVTCYDHWSATLLNGSSVDFLLVGDSVAMVVHGYSSTLSATPAMLTLHTAAVSRGAPDKLIVTDMPFPSFRQGVSAAMRCVDKFVKAGAQAVKIEGVEGHADVIAHIHESGIPVMGHLGLTPQSVHRLGGYKVQGTDDESAAELLQSATRLEDAGCFCLVLECVPAALAERITKALSIPTIGIGAGPHVDGQVLVLHDLLGLTSGRRPRFVRQFLEGSDEVGRAVDAFAAAVRDGSYPSPTEQYE